MTRSRCWRGSPYAEFDGEDFAAPEIARLVALQARAVAGRAAAHAALARLTPETDSFAPPLPPTGTLTFLFTDLEGSTRLWEDHPQAMQGALARHDELLRDAIEAHDGRIVKMRGDGVHGVFATAHRALEAALAAQRALCSEQWGATGALRVRIAVHTGEAEHRAGDYYGTAVNRAARLMGVGHGQQVLVSHATQQIVGDALPPGLQLVDLGEHRLPDLATVERVFQVVHPELPDRFPPLRAVDVNVSLAVPATSFHGRAHELDALADLASQPGTVTLVGPGGVGKTRLALELSTEVGHRFRDGVRFIDLTPVVADAVPATFAAGLGLVRRGRRSFHDSIVGWLGRKHVLLLVDNCEHVLDRVAPLLRDIGEASSQVTVLCTSRQPLGFPGEVVYPVEPLAVPSSDDPSAIESSPAVRLFVDRASAARYDLQLPPEELAVVAQICRRLDGIPLAVELAAARAGSMSSQDLLANLDPRSPILAMRTPDHPRHRTLFSAIEWSYDLLSPESRALFERLSVFAGSWTVQAARRICTDRTSDNDVLALLADLVDRSMIVADVGQRATRYRMLSTLRDFAADRLPDDAATAELTARHARYFCDLAAAAEPGLRTSDEARWVAEITADLGNLHAAHRWARDHGDIDLDARLLAALWNYGLQHLSAEYFRWVEEALAVLSFEDHPLVAELHGIAALGAWLRGDLRQSMRSCRAAFDAEQRLDSGMSLPARMAIVVATAYAPEGYPAREPIAAEAPTRFMEVVEWSRAVDEPYWVVYSMITGSLGLVMAGDLERAATLAGRALQLATLSECPLSMAWARFAAATALEPSDAEGAEQLLDDAVRGARSVDGRLVLGLGMSLQATLRRRLGRPLDAVPLLLELIDHWDRLGNPPQLWHTVRESAMCLSLLDADATAARLLASVDGAELVMPLLPADRAHLAATRGELLRRLGEAAGAKATVAGAAMSRGAAIELTTRTLVRIRDLAAPSY